MNRQPNSNETTLASTSRTGEDPPGVSLEEASGVSELRNQGKAGSVDNDDDSNQADTADFCAAEKEDEDVVLPLPALVSSPAPIESTLLARMPGAFQVPPPGTPGADYEDPLQVMLEEDEEREEELRSVNEEPSTDVETENQQQSAQPSNIVSAYRVAEQETIIATPLKDNRLRILMYGFLVTAAVALLVGLSVGLTAKVGDEQQPDDSLGRLVSSAMLTADEIGSYMKADRYHRTENGKEIATTTGSAVLNRCEVIPCNEGGCDILSYGKVYKPGCCRGEDCDRGDKCGVICPRKRNICHPSFVGCKDASCFECERGPSGEELYQYRSASFDVNCLRSGVAFGLNDKKDKVPRFYNWSIGCAVNVRGGNELENYGPGEYICMAVRSGDGITKTVSQPIPCQLIQLAKCGCAPDDVHTLGLPVPGPNKPCKTKEDCPYLCSDAGEEEAKMLCEAFPGIQWWEGDNTLYQNFFYEPHELYFYGNVTIQIDIFGE